MKDPCAHVVPSAVAGDGLLALQPLTAGDLILDIPTLKYTALDNAQIPQRCSNCLGAPDGDGLRQASSPLKLQVCSGCRTLRYCSKKCQAFDWKNGHKHECKAFARIPSPDGSTLPNVARLCIRILTTDHHAGSLSLGSLQSHSSDITRADGERLESLRILSTGICEYTSLSNAAGKPSSKPHYDRVFDTLAAIHTNALTLNTPAFDPIGICIDSTICKINHSCSPNAFVVFDGASLHLRTLNAIETGEEIFISYVDSTNPYHRRQKELKDQYYFACKCSTCKSAAMAVPNQFIHDPSKLGKPTKDAINTSLAALQLSPIDLSPNDADYLPPSPISPALSALQAYGFSTIDRSQHPPPEQSPEASLTLLIATIAGLRATTVWPIHRQPLPALLQSHFLTSITLGNWLDALHTGLTLYYRVHPTIHPQRIHPLRVVHAFAVAKLAMYISSTPSLSPQLSQHVDPTRTAPGGRTLPHDANVGMLVVGLLVEVCEGVRKSHGMGTDFANAVAAKVLEVVQASGPGFMEVMSEGYDDSEVGVEVRRQLHIFDVWVRD